MTKLIQKIKIYFYLRKIIKKVCIKFWGENHYITPTLIDHINGDGLQVVYLEPMMTRPNYYVLRIDSSIDIDDDEFDYDEILLEPIEEECGNFTSYEESLKLDNDGDNYYTFSDDPKGLEGLFTWDDVHFPVLHWEGGTWGVLRNFKTIDGESE